MTVIDLNVDIAEGFGAWRIADDDALLAVVSSANVACGFHAGDPGTIRRACVTAVAHSVSIGAQVGYRDLAGFGRRFMDVPPAELVDDLLYQMAALQGMAAVAGGRLAYVKPHGALYNAIATHEEQAAAVVEAVTTFDASLAVLGMPGSRWLALAAEAGLETVAEAFADRAYTPDGRLVSRREPGAVLHDPAVVAERAVRFATEATVVAIDGSVLAMPARSICVHSDTPGAVELVTAVRAAMSETGVRVESFR
ncbi:LamB/YcsF family protein [Actinophytocola sp. NPDC049390]|uniref:LamB/YcsF family protein n=1 Tax=Actinophytocola sp. NPDC049390 TaxID=3363894 RepID=UPI003789EBD7